ncbi:hypothetical protein BS78_03G200400 [Paspalum vaginatum]|nr:hypothetical protein BS78_03G200400 [Paspalum vaginatum]
MRRRPQVPDIAPPLTTVRADLLPLGLLQHSRREPQGLGPPRKADWELALVETASNVSGRRRSWAAGWSRCSWAEFLFFYLSYGIAVTHGGSPSPPPARADSPSSTLSLTAAQWRLPWGAFAACARPRRPASPAVSRMASSWSAPAAQHRLPSGALAACARSEPPASGCPRGGPRWAVNGRAEGAPAATGGSSHAGACALRSRPQGMARSRGGRGATTQDFGAATGGAARPARDARVDGSGGRAQRRGHAGVRRLVPGLSR